MSYRIQPTIAARGATFSAGASQLRAGASGSYGQGNGIGSRAMAASVSASTMQATGAPSGVMAAGLQPQNSQHEIMGGMPAVSPPASVGAGTVQRAGAGFGLNGAGRIGKLATAYKVSGTPTPGGGGAPWFNPEPPGAGPWTGEGGAWTGEGGDWY